MAQSAFELTRDLGGAARARRMRDAYPQRDTAAWKTLAGMGWLTMLVPESQDGLGLGVVDLAALMESVGRTLVPEPIAESVVAAFMMSSMAAPETARHIEELSSGCRTYLPVIECLDFQFGAAGIEVADCADDSVLLVRRGTGSNADARLLHCDAPGVEISFRRCVDGSALTRLEISETAWQEAARLGKGEAIAKVWNRAYDALLMADSAAMIGLMNEFFQATLEFMKLRTQFGSPIGTFQALQHRAASCYVQIVSCRALLYEACKAFGDDPDGQARAACAVKSKVSASVLLIMKELIQFHGAIGFTDEHDIGLAFRRAMTLAARRGNSRFHESRYGQMRGCQQ